MGAEGLDKDQTFGAKCPLYQISEPGLHYYWAVSHVLTAVIYECGDFAQLFEAVRLWYSV